MVWQGLQRRLIWLALLVTPMVQALDISVQGPGPNLDSLQRQWRNDASSSSDWFYPYADGSIGYSFFEWKVPEYVDSRGRNEDHEYAAGINYHLEAGLGVQNFLFAGLGLNLWGKPNDDDISRDENRFHGSSAGWYVRAVLPTPLIEPWFDIGRHCWSVRLETDSDSSHMDGCSPVWRTGLAFQLDRNSASHQRFILEYSRTRFEDVSAYGFNIGLRGSF
ncbi:hypothetical protein [Oceanobacter mangrovi]|uniref:hypothetical protein n=1 Tax=Oceanobacter mangrovi TaxID=2862510 RepID=UPI001C8D1F60|nr:hypothetical protein [Oceanobacter mangrovi]